MYISTQKARAITYDLDNPSSGITAVSTISIISEVRFNAVSIFFTIRLEDATAAIASMPRKFGSIDTTIVETVLSSSMPLAPKREELLSSSETE